MAVASGLKSDRNISEEEQHVAIKVESQYSDKVHFIKADEDKSMLDSKTKTDSKQDIKTRTINTALLPDSPPRSPSKEEEVEQDQKRSGSSRHASLNADLPSRETVVIRNGPTQYATHLPRAESKALKTFEGLKANSYQNAKVGQSRGYEKEAMVCECRYRHGTDDLIMACTEEADCINRLTQVECLKSECNCGQYCQNQRFQRGEYADVEIIETEKKGFGLRAGSNISTDQFIYEYIGEVVEQKEFLRRMEQYRDESIRHFYFMMLQREEFLDATKRGGIARFVNHSCNPNCYVSKWHVGKYMRMGIFAKRDIQKGEELTFNYNVDRYGNDAQICYCGEPNCVGTIGGKTQTDIGGMDQLFIDALGIAEEVDSLEAKGTRKKKSRHLDEDFTPTLRPIEEEEVAKVITAVRQATSNRNILQKLLSRIHMTQDTTVQRCLVRLHGFVLMAGVMDEWKDDKDIILLAMGSLARWPLLAKNKVVDSGVDKLVQDFTQEDDPEISSLASDLSSAWDALEMSYRIARKETSTSVAKGTHSSNNLEHRKISSVDDDLLPSQDTRKLEDARAPNSVSNRLEAVAPNPNRPARFTAMPSRSLKVGGGQESPSTPRTPDEHSASPSWNSRTFRSGYMQGPRYVSYSRYQSPGPEVKKHHTLSRPTPPTPLSIEEIIRKANESEALQRKQAEEEAAAKAKAILEAEQRKKSPEQQVQQGSKRKNSTLKQSNGEKRVRGAEEQSFGIADRRLEDLVRPIVVGCMSTYKEEVERSTFKKQAKYLTHIICDKERRSNSRWPPPDDLVNGLSSEKRKKIKQFAMEYILKLVARIANTKVKIPTTPPRPSLQVNGKHVASEDGARTVSSHDSELEDQQTILDGSSSSTSPLPSLSTS